MISLKFQTHDSAETILKLQQISNMYIPGHLLNLMPLNIAKKRLSIPFCNCTQFLFIVLLQSIS